MAGEEQDAVWPLPKFNFSVEIEGFSPTSWQEVSGLDVETQVIEYRSGNSKAFSPVKMPGIAKTGNVTLKKGVFPKDHHFSEWCSQIKMNTIKRKNVTIKLLDQTGKPSMVWTLANAWPSKITGTDLKSDGNEVAIETMELVHEGLTIENG